MRSGRWVMARAGGPAPGLFAGSASARGPTRVGPGTRTGYGSTLIVGSLRLGDSPFEVLAGLYGRGASRVHRLRHLLPLELHCLARGVDALLDLLARLVEGVYHRSREVLGRSLRRVAHAPRTALELAP